MDDSQKIICIVGPTGCGKTKLAVKLASANNGVIISADSRQVYRGLDNGTNKEGTTGKYEGFTVRFIDNVPQFMIDIVDPGVRFTLADWLTRVKDLLQLIKSWGKTPFLVGGTGLYVTALLENYQLGGEDLNIRKTLSEMDLGQLQLMATNYEIMPEDRNNRRRLVRMLERDSSGSAPYTINLDLKSLILHSKVERSVSYQRCDNRIDKVFDLVVDEVRGLIKKGISTEWLESLGLDYRYATFYILEKLTKEEAIERLKFSTHSFIRRQEVWWRHHGKIHDVTNETEASKLVSKFL